MPDPVNICARVLFCFLISSMLLLLLQLSHREMPEAPLGPKGKDLWGMPDPELYLCSFPFPPLINAAAAIVTQGNA
jgi:hypothetical protein